ncbi:hypothetical protein DAEQUDRAFT_768014 [Daedalea quercina L-15889]|uniref:ABM domain-containing protein n=1 Tax=Daedalea quercina L-15889 TaxID=1314783 RepID=A0A165N2W0_9APHY|nr:hypothetical protein DAEQUDRAFT_768014 [Daedalea quercina L-15889]
MPAACVEIACAPATEAFIADPHADALVRPALEILRGVPGVRHIHYALDPARNYAYVLNVWASLDDHRRLQADGKTYAALAKRVALVKARRSDIEHVLATSGDPCQVLRAPANEVVHFAVKSGGEVGALEGLVGTLVEALRRACDVSVFWGRIAEREDTLCLVAGWNSVETSWETALTNAEVSNIVKEIGVVADMQRVSLKLTEWVG